MRVKVLLQITAEDGTAVGAAEEVAAFEKADGAAGGPRSVDRRGQGADWPPSSNGSSKLQAASWAERHRCCAACGARRRSKGSYPSSSCTLYGDVRTRQPATTSLPVPRRGRSGDRVAAARPDPRSCRSRSGSTSRRAGRRSCPTPPRPDCSPTSCRSRPVPTPPRCASMCCVWPSAPRPNSGRSGPVSSMAVRRTGPGCPSRKVASWSASMAAMSATGKTGRPISRSSSASRCPKTVTPVTSVWCMATTASRNAVCSTLLKSQGLQANQDVTFLTDGGEEVRALTEFVTPESEHVLDWFHITMRLTVLSQYARGVAQHDDAAGNSLLAELETDQVAALARQSVSSRRGNRVLPGRRGRAGGGLPQSEQVRPRRARVCRLHRLQRRQPDQLWRAIPRRRTHLLVPGGVHGERRHQQAFRQTSADAVDKTRRASAAADPNAHARRHAPASLRAMVSTAWPTTTRLAPLRPPRREYPTRS